VKFAGSVNRSPVVARLISGDRGERRHRWTVGWMMRRVMMLVLTALLATACTSASRTASGQQGSVANLPPGASVKAVPHTPGTAGTPAPTHIAGKVKPVLNTAKAGLCALITREQVNQVMAVTLPAPQLVPVGTFDECSTTQVLPPGSRAEPVHVAWAVPPVTNASVTFRQYTISLPGSDAVSGVGGKAYCRTVTSSASQLYVLDGSRFLEVFADSCSHAIALAGIALPRL
jgi:hypothetical protein